MSLTIWLLCTLGTFFHARAFVRANGDEIDPAIVVMLAIIWPVWWHACIVDWWNA